MWPESESKYVFHIRLESMKDGLLELHMAIPSLQMETSVTASLKNSNGLILQLETALNMPETTSAQKAILRYGNEVPFVMQLFSIGCHWVLNNIVDDLQIITRLNLRWNQMQTLRSRNFSPIWRVIAASCRRVLMICLTRKSPRLIWSFDTLFLKGWRWVYQCRCFIYITSTSLFLS